MVSKRSTRLHDKLKESVLADDDGRAEYEAFKLQLELASQMKKAREDMDITQDNVAKKLKTNKSVIIYIVSIASKL